MKYTIFGRIAAVIVLSAVIAVLLWFSYRLLKTKKPNPPAAQTKIESKSEEIVRGLMPNGDWADVSKLDRFERTETIQAVIDARRTAKEERAIGLTFLLAALGHEYAANRDNLLQEFHKCASKGSEEFHCADLISEYLMELGRRGDVSLLPALFDVADKADGHFAESLGGFYSDVLSEKTEEFLKALAIRSKKDQWDLCYAAGSEDGSGMAADRLSDVRSSLLRLTADHKKQLLAPVARRCLSGVDAAHKAAVKSFQELQQPPGGN